MQMKESPYTEELPLPINDSSQPILTRFLMSVYALSRFACFSMFYKNIIIYFICRDINLIKLMKTQLNIKLIYSKANEKSSKTLYNLPHTCLGGRYNPPVLNIRACKPHLQALSASLLRALSFSVVVSLLF